MKKCSVFLFLLATLVTVLSEVGLVRLYGHARKLRSPQCSSMLRERVEKLYLPLDPVLRNLWLSVLKEKSWINGPDIGKEFLRIV